MIDLTIRAPRFEPPEVRIPVGTKVKRVVKNLDPSAEEFESHELKRAKIIAGNSTGIIFIGPLTPRSYPFFGDFNPETARGRLVAE